MIGYLIERLVSGLVNGLYWVWRDLTRRHDDDRRWQ